MDLFLVLGPHRDRSIGPQDVPPDPTSLLPQDGLYHYLGIEDLTVNANGHKFMALCKTCDLLVANHLVTGNTELRGGLSFRKRQNWISEIDLCVASATMLNRISQLALYKDTNLPSDHAPLAITVRFEEDCEKHTLVQRSMTLGDYSAYDTRKPKLLSKKPVNYEDINTEGLKEILINSQIPDPLAGIADE